MKKIILILLIVFCSSYISIANNFPLADNTTYKALFIGIDNYKISDLDPLESSSKDSRLLKNLLEKKYGFTDSKILTNEDATKENILSSIRKLVTEAAEEDHLLIFFAGHGAEFEKEGYWIPADVTSLNPSNLVSNVEVQQMIKETKSKHVLVLSDGFFAGSAFKSPSFFVNNDGTEGYYKKIQMLISRQAITSGGTSPAFDMDEKRSVFTKYLIKFLEVNNTEILDAGELYELIKYPIFSNSPNMPRFGHLQYTGHEGGHFIFRITEQKELIVDKPKIIIADKPVKTDDVDNTDKTDDTKNTVVSEKAEPVEKIPVKEEPKVEICNLEASIKQGDRLIVEDWNSVKVNVDYNNQNASIQWFLNEKAIGSTKELSIKEEGEYRVVVSTSATCKQISTIEVSQKKVDLSKVDVFIEEGNNVEYTMKGILSAKTFTKEAIQYEWKLGGVVISTEPVLTVFRSGEYEIALTYNGKQIARDYSKVVVHPRTYSSVQGDTPESIAEMFYRDGKLQSLIYKANLDIIKIGEAIPANTNLVIPAKEEAQQSLSIKSLKIAGVSNFAPFTSTGSYKNGIVTNIIKTVFEAMEQENEISFVPLTKQENLMLANKISAAYPIRKTEENLAKYLFSKELYSVSNVLFSRAKEPFDYSDEKNIKKKTVAFVTGSDIKEIDNLLAKKYIKVRPCVSLEEAFRLLQREQVDLIACSSLSAYDVFMNNEKIEQKSFYLVTKPIGTTPLHLAISNTNPFALDIIANFNAMLDSLDAKGEITKIIDEHLDEFQKKP